MSDAAAETKKPLVGVLSIQGAFEEHQACLEASGCRTKQVRGSGWKILRFVGDCLEFRK